MAGVTGRYVGHAFFWRAMNPITIGTCGWSYKGWAGVFYPEGTPPGEFLPAYAKRFPAVEVDSTFYRSPSRKMVEGSP